MTSPNCDEKPTMSMIEVSSDSFVCAVAAGATPSLKVHPGDVLRIHCRNALDRTVGPGPVRAAAPNPATGPIAVVGAAPSHALRLEILSIACDSIGYISGPSGDRAVPIRDGCAIFADDMHVPIAPMIGVLGLAPAQGSWKTTECGPYGGNLDTNDLAPGATIHLPVFQPGGLFVAGDVHAVMGDGEIGGQGLEVAAEVVLRVGLEPDPLTTDIYLVRNDELMTIGSGRTLDEACDQAARAMISLLAHAGSMDEFSATKFLGLAGQLRIGQQCCPTKSARVAVPLRHFPELRRRLCAARES